MVCIQQTTLLCGSPNCRHWNVNSPALCCSPGQEHHEAHPLFGPGKLVHCTPRKAWKWPLQFFIKKNDDPSFEALKLPQCSIKNSYCLAQNFLRNPTRPAQQGLRRQRSPVCLPSSLHGTLGEKYDKQSKADHSTQPINYIYIVTLNSLVLQSIFTYD